ncbi:MAG: hypothetical protein ABJH98_17995 [Reichenbachiella sp.]|uniref:hypothetical protein n=1 Tax=Reichenbachiella sp. TaxID=2184521 RepID=UPI003297D91A
MEKFNLVLLLLTFSLIFAVYGYISATQRIGKKASLFGGIAVLFIIPVVYIDSLPTPLEEFYLWMRLFLLLIVGLAFIIMFKTLWPWFIIRNEKNP